MDRLSEIAAMCRLSAPADSKTEGSTERTENDNNSISDSGSIKNENRDTTIEKIDVKKVDVVDDNGSETSENRDKEMRDRDNGNRSTIAGRRVYTHRIAAAKSNVRARSLEAPEVSLLSFDITTVSVFTKAIHYYYYCCYCYCCSHEFHCYCHYCCDFFY